MEVEDNGVGITEERLRRLKQELKEGTARESYGLVNVNNRIRLLYGQDSGVAIESEEGKGTCVRVVLFRLQEQRGKIVMVNLIICDDELILRNGLKSWVETSGLPLKVTATAENGNRAMELIIQEQPFIALMDINMPGMSGLDIIEEAKKQHIKTRFIIITGHDEFQYAKELAI